MSLLFLGCGSLPSSGPSTVGIKRHGGTEERDGFYQIFEMNQPLVNSLRASEVQASGPGLATLAGPGSAKPGNALARAPRTGTLLGAASPTVAHGDVVSVVIFSSGGVFAAPEVEGSVETQIPPQVVDISGKISVPFVGRVRAAGKTLHEIEKEISDSLRDKVIDPWVVVTTGERAGGDLVTVSGDVVAPQRVAIPISGLRVLDALAASGGSKARPYETQVSVRRGSKMGTSLLGEINERPAENVYLQPGDTVMVSTRDWSFLTLGALGQRQHPFNSAEMNLLEAISNSGGLHDRQANPMGVFVLRFEPERFVRSLGRNPGTVTDAGVPVVYNVNLASGQGMFLASQFAVRDKDVIFVGNAGTVGLMKALDIFNAVTAPARSGLSTAAGFETLAQ